MTLWAHVHGGYPSYEVSGHAWGQNDYDAFKLVQALKGKQINGYATMRKLDGKWVTFKANNTAPAFELWGEWAAAKVKQISPDGCLLVPVPSSDCLAIGTDEKGRKLAEAIRQRAPALEVAEALHWAVQFQKSSEGGPRDPDTLFQNVRVLTHLPKREVILIDDVVTGGGHLIACARALRWAGHKVEHAVCVAHTVNSPPSGGMFSIPAWDLEAEPIW